MLNRLSPALDLTVSSTLNDSSHLTDDQDDQPFSNAESALKTAFALLANENWYVDYLVHPVFIHNPFKSICCYLVDLIGDLAVLWAIPVYHI